MESKEFSLLKKIKILMGKKLNSLFVGEYHSAFKGYGLSFDNVREYQYGDSIRNIDWNVSARMNHLYIKEYIEERELSVVLMVDVSGSFDFGSKRSKRDVMLEIVTLFLYLSQMNNDRVSVLLFSDKIEKFIPPKKGRKFILKVLDEIIMCKPESRKTNLSVAIDFVRRMQKKRSVVFMISDFLVENKEYLLKLKLLGKKHDIIPIQISDPLEKEMGFFGLAEFVDLETGKSFMTDAIPEKGNYPILHEFDCISLNTVDSIELPVLKYFEKRNRTRLTRSV